MRSILQHLNDCVNRVESNGRKAIQINSPFASERAQTKPAVEVFLLLLGIGLVGGLAFSLSGISEDVLPGPEASVNINQDGQEVFLTVDSMDSNVDDITVDISGADSDGDLSFNGSDTTTTNINVDSSVSSLEVGKTIIVSGLDEGDIITVTAHAGDSDNANQVETFEVGPTG